MTPAARIAAAIDILDDVLRGAQAERVVTAWARRHRFAGASDRSAIRDHVYQALRRRRSLAALGGGASGRGIMIGMERAAGRNPAGSFGAGKHAPPPLGVDEARASVGPWPEGVELDVPDWLLPHFRRSLGSRMAAILRLMQRRAPVHARINLARTTRERARVQLAEIGVIAEPHPLSPAAVQIVDGARRIAQTELFAEGLLELQDAASQAVSDAIPVPRGARVLDYCAGAGGKTLAMAARAEARWFAHDVSSERLSDLPSRARRAGREVTIIDTKDAALMAPFDVVLVDAPCSGSGSWRRDPQGKWSLTQAELDRLVELQRKIIDEAADLVAPGGLLAYATCSLLDVENAWQTAAFRRRHPGWRLGRELSLTPALGGDGFYLALLKR